jgi:hypothetical protein
MRHCRGCDGWFPRPSFNGKKNCRECNDNPRPSPGNLPIEKLLGGNIAYRGMRAEARRLEAETGVPHDVDHIIPKWGKPTRPGLVPICGLHVPSNLRVIPKSLNRAEKRWRFTEEEARAEEARLMEIAMSGPWVASTTKDENI